MFEAETGQFRFHRGPVFSQLVLADEVNRATPKAQSALLEAMEEHQVTADGQTYPLNEPFFVIATQNPAYQIGTFPLPESQLDRFLMRIELGYPEPRSSGNCCSAAIAATCSRNSHRTISPQQLLRLQGEVPSVHVSDALLDYVQAIARYTRQTPGIRSGPVTARGDRAAARGASVGVHAVALGRVAGGRASRAARRGRPSPFAARNGALPRCRAGRPARARSSPGALSGVSRRTIRAIRAARRPARASLDTPSPGRDDDPVELQRQRIYILPTGSGIAYATMVFAMLLGGMNYNNNLGLGLTFLLVSLGLVAMHHCHGTLSGLKVRLLEAEPAFVGEDVCITACCCRTIRASRGPALELAIGRTASRWHRRRPGRRRDRRPTCAFERCGAAVCDSIASSLQRVIPLGLFRAWAVIHPDYAAIAWPRPATRERAPPAHAHRHRRRTGPCARRRGLHGPACFQPGDSIHRIAWKAYARGQGLHTKQYAGTDVVSHVFDWDSLPGLDTEHGWRNCAAGSLDAHERRRSVRLAPARHRDRH